MKSQFVLLLAASLTASVLFTGSNSQLMQTRGVTMLYSSHNMLLNTSMKKEQGKYTKKVKELFGGMLDHLESH